MEMRENSSREKLLLSGDMTEAGGGVKAAIITRMKSALKKFRELESQGVYTFSKFTFHDFP